MSDGAALWPARRPRRGVLLALLVLVVATAVVYVTVQPRAQISLAEASDDWVSVGKEKAAQLKQWLDEVRAMQGEVRMFQTKSNEKAVAELVRLGRVRDMLEVLRNQAPLEVAPPVTSVEQPQPQAHSQWGYGDGADGPAHWGDLSSDWVMCKAGQQQSPINLGPDVEEVKMPALGWVVTDTDASVTHKVGTSTQEGREFYNGHTFEVEDLGAPTLLLDGTEYTLQQFHFHTPSEHTVEGRHYDMEMHLVHSAIIDGSKQLAVVAVLFNKGNRSPHFLRGLLQSALPQVPHPSRSQPAPAATSRPRTPVHSCRHPTSLICVAPSDGRRRGPPRTSCQGSPSATSRRACWWARSPTR